MLTSFQLEKLVFPRARITRIVIEATFEERNVDERRVVIHEFKHEYFECVRVLVFRLSPWILNICQIDGELMINLKHEISHFVTFHTIAPTTPHLCQHHDDDQVNQRSAHGGDKFRIARVGVAESAINHRHEWDSVDYCAEHSAQHHAYHEQDNAAGANETEKLIPRNVTKIKEKFTLVNIKLQLNRCHQYGM